MPDRALSEVMADPDLQPLPWDQVVSRAPAAWLDTLVVRDQPAGRRSTMPVAVEGRRTPPPETGSSPLRLEVVVPTYGRITFGGPSAFAVGLGARGRVGTVQVGIVLHPPDGRSGLRPTLGWPRERAWAVDIRGDVSLVLRHDLLVPVPDARALLPRVVVARGTGTRSILDVRASLGQLREIDPDELEIPLGTSTLRLRPGPTMSLSPPLDLGGRKFVLGRGGLVVSVGRLAPSFTDSHLSFGFLDGRLALATA